MRLYHWGKNTTSPPGVPTPPAAPGASVNNGMERIMYLQDNQPPAKMTPTAAGTGDGRIVMWEDSPDPNQPRRYIDSPGSPSAGSSVPPSLPPNTPPIVNPIPCSSPGSYPPGYSLPPIPDRAPIMNSGCGDCCKPPSSPYIAASPSPAPPERSRFLQRVWQSIKGPFAPRQTEPAVDNASQPPRRRHLRLPQAPRCNPAREHQGSCRDRSIQLRETNYDRRQNFHQAHAGADSPNAPPLAPFPTAPKMVASPRADIPPSTLPPFPTAPKPPEAGISHFGQIKTPMQPAPMGAGGDPMNPLSSPPSFRPTGVSAMPPALPDPAGSNSRSADPPCRAFRRGGILPAAIRLPRATRLVRRSRHFFAVSNVALQTKPRLRCFSPQIGRRAR